MNAWMSNHTYTQCTICGAVITAGSKHSHDEENKDSYYLGELLAIIHGDGGHYQGEHGTEKAVKDAIAKFYELKRNQAPFPAGFSLCAKDLHIHLDTQGDLFCRYCGRLLAAALVEQENK